MTRSVIYFLILALVFIFSVHTLNSVNQDIGRHLTLGKIIWETGSVPGTNLFSYTAPDYPFINHHWLGEVVFYLLSLKIGLTGLIVFKAGILTLAFALALLAIGSAPVQLSALTAICAILILIERTDVRPEMFSFLFLAWFLFVLFRQPKNSKLLWSLPLIQLLWANSHIYFFLGPAIYLFFVVGELVKFGRPALTKRIILVGLALGMVNLLNPFGWQGALYPLRIMHEYGYSIVENKSPFFLRPYGYPWLTTWALFTGIFIIAISFALNWRKFRENIFGFLLMVMMAGLAFFMIRNYPLFALTLIPVAGKNFLESGWRLKDKFLTFATGIVILSLMYSVVTNQIYQQARLGKSFGLAVPQGAQKAVDFVRAKQLKGPIFNNFDIGSFLIWKLPEEPVFIDGRPEAYPYDFIQNIYIPMQEDPKLWQKYSDQYGINYVFWNYQDITPWAQKFMRDLVKNKNWPLVYKDDTIAIFVRNP